MSRFACLALLVGVIGLSAGCASSGAATTAGIALDRLSWCNKPAIAFEDDGVSPSATIGDWPQAQRVLGFTPLLPPSLPVGACLASAGGAVRNPIFGGRFSITYELAQQGALSLAESPQQQVVPTPQCSAGTAAPVPLNSCHQTQAGLDITLTSTLAPAQLRTLLGELRASVAWVPRDTPTPATTP